MLKAMAASSAMSGHAERWLGLARPSEAGVEYYYLDSELLH
jgi:hypothetical protein